MKYMLLALMVIVAPRPVVAAPTTAVDMLKHCQYDTPFGKTMKGKLKKEDMHDYLWCRAKLQGLLIGLMLGDMGACMNGSKDTYNNLGNGIEEMDKILHTVATDSRIDLRDTGTAAAALAWIILGLGEEVSCAEYRN